MTPTNTEITVTLRNGVVVAADGTEWRLLPTIETWAMDRACRNIIRVGNGDLWGAMLAASPPVPQELGNGAPAVQQEESPMKITHIGVSDNTSAPTHSGAYFTALPNLSAVLDELCRIESALTRMFNAAVPANPDDLADRLRSVRQQLEVIAGAAK